MILMHLLGTESVLKAIDVVAVIASHYAYVILLFQLCRAWPWLQQSYFGKVVTYLALPYLLLFIQPPSPHKTLAQQHRYINGRILLALLVLLYAPAGCRFLCLLMS